MYDLEFRCSKAPWYICWIFWGWGLVGVYLSESCLKNPQQKWILQRLSWNLKGIREAFCWKEMFHRSKLKIFRHPQFPSLRCLRHLHSLYLNSRHLLLLLLLHRLVVQPPQPPAPREMSGGGGWILWESTVAAVSNLNPFLLHTHTHTHTHTHICLKNKETYPSPHNGWWFVWLFVHWDYNQRALFVFVLLSQFGGELFLPKRLWFSFGFYFHRCIGSSLTWKLRLRNSGGGTPFWWWCVFWKNFEDIVWSYLCVYMSGSYIIYIIYIYICNI